MHLTSLRFALVLAMFPGIALAAEKAPTQIEQRMSQDELARSGLDRLNPEELKFLNDWIRTKGVSAAIAPVKKRDGSLEYRHDETPREVINAQMVGIFTGWRGKTRFTLDNGQQWEQVESGAYSAQMNAPKVTIRPGIMDSWLMSVLGCNCSVRVKRIK